MKLCKNLQMFRSFLVRISKKKKVLKYLRAIVSLKNYHEKTPKNAVVFVISLLEKFENVLRNYPRFSYEKDFESLNLCIVTSFSSKRNIYKASDEKLTLDVFLRFF